MGIYDIIDQEKYEEYDKKNNIIYLNKDTRTTEAIEKFFESNEKRTLIDLGYKVLIKRYKLDNNDIPLDLYYSPFIIVKKFECIHDISDQSFTMSEIRKSTHGYQQANNMALLDDYTYVRKDEISAQDTKSMPKITSFASFIEDYILEVEQNIQCESNKKEIFKKELYDKLQKTGLEYNFHDKDKIILVKARDEEQHKRLEKGHLLKVTTIGARFRSCQNPRGVMQKSIKPYIKK